MDKTGRATTGPSRRRFLAAGAAFGAATLGVAGMPATASAMHLNVNVRRLKLHNARTDERLEVPYWAEDRYFGEALMQIDHLLRDIPTGEVKPIKLELLDLLYRVWRKLGSDQPYVVISGYRSARTNRNLAKRRPGVATNSLHIEGMAVDLLLPGVALSDLAETAWALRAGGVGHYPKSGFVHLDVGWRRHWNG